MSERDLLIVLLGYLGGSVLGGVGFSVTIYLIARWRINRGDY